jgi:hypothetical protein
VLAVVLILVLAGINAGQTSAAPTIQPVSVTTPKPVVRPSTVKRVPATTEASTRPPIKLTTTAQTQPEPKAISTTDPPTRVQTTVEITEPKPIKTEPPETTLGASDLAETPSQVDTNLDNAFAKIVTAVAYQDGLTVTAAGLDEAEASGREEIVTPLGADYAPSILRRATYFANLMSTEPARVSGARFYTTQSGSEGIVVGVVVQNDTSDPACNITFDLTMYDASTPNKVAVTKNHHVYIPRSKFIVPAGQSGFVAIDIPRKYLKSYPDNSADNLGWVYSNMTVY